MSKLRLAILPLTTIAFLCLTETVPSDDVIDWHRLNVTIQTVECTHPKLVAKEGNWGFDLTNPGCPRSLRLRKYLCKKCKAEVVILDAIEMPKEEEDLTCYSETIEFSDLDAIEYKAEYEVEWPDKVLDDLVERIEKKLCERKEQ